MDIIFPFLFASSLSASASRKTDPFRSFPPLASTLCVGERGGRREEKYEREREKVKERRKEGEKRGGEEGREGRGG